MVICDVPQQDVSHKGANIGRAAAGEMASSSVQDVPNDRLWPEKHLTITVCHAVSGEVLTRVRVRRDDTVGRLREAVLRETGQDELALHLVFESRVLDDQTILKDVGLRDGDVVFLVRTPLLQVSAPFGGAARIWRPQNGDARNMLIAQLDGRVRSAAFAPPGQTLLLVGVSGEAEIWGVEMGDFVCRLAPPDGARIVSGSFSHDGRRIVGAADGTKAAVWCASTGDCLKILSGHGDAIKSVCFSPDGALVATASRDWQARLWEARTGKFAKALIGHTGVVNSVVFFNNGVLVGHSLDGLQRTSLGRHLRRMPAMPC